VGLVLNLVEEVRSWACETVDMKTAPLILGTLEGYSVEGGYDRPHEPATIYSPTIALGRQQGPGDGANLWREYEAVLDLVRELGLDGIRITPEWARIEPRQHHIDSQSIARYHEVLAYAKGLGLHVTVALIDRVWPAWLGMEAWLLPWVVPCVLTHAERVATELGDVFDSLVVFTDGEGLVRRGFVEELGPPWRRGAKDDARSAAIQVENIEHLVRASNAGRKVVPTFATVASDVPDQLQSVLRSGDYQEVHVETLVRGGGPVASRAGLLARHDGQWRVSADETLRSVLLAR